MSRTLLIIAEMVAYTSAVALRRPGWYFQALARERGGISLLLEPMARRAAPC